MMDALAVVFDAEGPRTDGSEEGGGGGRGPYGEVVFEVGRLRANFSNIWLAGPFGVGAQIESTRPYLHLQHADGQKIK